jgi:hypothetical protein
MKSATAVTKDVPSHTIPTRPSLRDAKAEEVISSTTFLWSDPIDTAYNSDNRHTQDMKRMVAKKRESTYTPFFQAYADMIPPLGLPVRKKTSSRNFHKHALGYVRDIWRCLIIVIYGRQIHFGCGQDKVLVWEKVSLLANVYTYAELLCATEDVLQSIRGALMSVEHIWRHIGQSPEMLFHIAYHFRLPRLYLDAAKHLVALSYPRRLENLTQGRMSRYYDDDKIDLLMAGRLQYDNAVHTVQVRVLERIADWAPGEQVSRTTVSGILLQLIRPELLSVLTKLGKTVKFCGQWYASGLAVLRKLYDIHSSTGDASPVISFLLNSDAVQRRFPRKANREDFLPRFLEFLGHLFKRSYRGNMLFCTISRHDYRYARRCHCPFEQNDSHVAALDLEALFQHRDTRPWPLNADDSGTTTSMLRESMYQGFDDPTFEPWTKNIELAYEIIPETDDACQACPDSFYDKTIDRYYRVASNDRSACVECYGGVRGGRGARKHFNPSDKRVVPVTLLGAGGVGPEAFTVNMKPASASYLSLVGLEFKPRPSEFSYLAIDPLAFTLGSLFFKDCALGMAEGKQDSE